MNATPNHRQNHPPTELDESCGYEMTERAFDTLAETEKLFDALAAEKGFTPGSALWKLERRAFDYETDVHCGPVELAAGPRPYWADPNSDFVSQYGNGGIVSSRPWLQRLDLHPGHLIGDHRRSATARLNLMQKASEVDPIVILNRFAEQHGIEGISKVAGSEFRFTLDEAAELAHLLLLIVDVARGTNDDIEQAVA